MNKKITISLLSLAVLAACSEPPPPPAPPKVVRTLTVAANDVAGSRTYAGEVHARYETTLGFRIPGKLTARLVDAGASVAAGQPLARIDASDYALQARQADAQRQLAEAEAKRYRDLKSRNFVSQSALDSRETSLQAAEAQASLARNQIGYTTLTADRAGVIAAVQAEPGQVLGAGQPVFRVAYDGEREIAIAIPEAEVARFKPGMAAQINLWAQGDGAEQKPLPGRIREIAAMADPATRTYAARVSLGETPAKLPLGLSATVRFPSGEAGAKAIRLPLTAIFQQGNQPAVWIIGKEQTVSLRPIQIATLRDDGALVATGLSGGEVIVAAGVHRLTAGEKVRLAEAAK